MSVSCVRRKHDCWHGDCCLLLALAAQPYLIATCSPCKGKPFFQYIQCLQILPEDSVQADVYQAAVQPVVEDVLNGYNGTIMAYGQTGAGKTYTLSSIQPDAIGMIPRAAAEVFAHIAKDVINEYTVFMSYIQIYMEMIQVDSPPF